MIGEADQNRPWSQLGGCEQIGFGQFVRIGNDRTIELPVHLVANLYRLNFLGGNVMRAHGRRSRPEQPAEPAANSAPKAGQSSFRRAFSARSVRGTDLLF